MALVGVLVLAAGAYGIYRIVFPPDRVVIRKRLHDLAEEVSFRRDGGSPLAAFASANRLSGYFTRDVEIRLGEGPGARVRVIQGRDELREAVAGVRASQGSVQVRLREVFVDRVDGREAVAQIIAGVRFDGESDETLVEYRLQLSKEGREWLIGRVEPVESLGM
jgi:hypothetical protein